MNTREIEDLLARYFEGQTSLEEEHQLRVFFREESVPPHLAAYKGLFSSFAESGKEELDDPDFEGKFLKAIGESPVIKMYPKRKRLIYITSMAAGFLLLLGLFFTFKQDVFQKVPKNTISNPELAYAETQKAILMLCGNFRTGIQQAEKLQAFDKGMEEIQKLRHFNDGIQQVKKFSDFYKFQKLVLNPGEKVHP